MLASVVLPAPEASEQRGNPAFALEPRADVEVAQPFLHLDGEHSHSP